MAYVNFKIFTFIKILSFIFPVQTQGVNLQFDSNHTALAELTYVIMPRLIDS